MATLESIEAQIDVFKTEMKAKFDAVDVKFDGVDTKLENLVLHQTCALCQGEGEINSPVDGEPGPPYTCPQCGGDGKIRAGQIDTVGDDESYG